VNTNTMKTQAVTKTSRRSGRLFYSVELRGYLNIFFKRKGVSVLEYNEKTSVNIYVSLYSPPPPQLLSFPSIRLPRAPCIIQIKCLSVQFSWPYTVVTSSRKIWYYFLNLPSVDNIETSRNSSGNLGNPR